MQRSVLVVALLAALALAPAADASRLPGVDFEVVETG
jgi:hypothetical protein